MRKLDRQLRRSLVESEKLRKANVKLFVSNLNRFLEKHIPRIAKLKDNATAQEAAAVLGGLQSGLVEAGLPSVVRKIQSSYREELSSLANRFDLVVNPTAAAEGLITETTLADFSSASVKALINNDIKRVTKLLSPYVDDISSTLLRTVISGDKPDITTLLDGTTETLESQLETELNTMLSSFSQTVSNERAKELGLELFVYIGPEDKITRDFCEAVLTEKDPPIYTREEIDALNDHPDHDSDLDVFTYRGGYNCRHRWVAISEEKAKELGWTEH